MNDARGRALRDKPADNFAKLAGWTQHFEAAGERVLAGDAETARRHYQVASSIANSWGGAGWWPGRSTSSR